METSSQDKKQSNQDCSDERHDQHLCYQVSQGFHISDKQEYEALTKDPKFQCGHCGRRATSKDNLCRPTDLWRHERRS